MTDTPIRLARQPLHPDITEEMIGRLVREFYARIRKDPELGPIFAETNTGDWEPHLRTMIDFWSSVMLMSGANKGRPMDKHKALTKVSPGHFERWLELFAATARDKCAKDIADLFVAKAGHIAESLRLGIFGLPSLQAASSAVEARQ